MLSILLTNPYEDIPYNVDFETVRRVKDTVSRIVELILGIAAGYIIVVMFLITAVDICYMIIPPLQELITSKNWDGSANNGKKFRLISKDATYAVRESCVGERSCLLIYLKRRSVTYIKAAVILFVIIGGSQIIIDIVMYFMRGILKGLE